MSLSISNRLRRLDTIIKKFEVQLTSSQNKRLLVAVLFFICLVLVAAKPEWNLALPTVIIFPILFYFLVTRSRREHRFLVRCKQWHSFLSRQQKRLQGLPTGEKVFAVEDPSYMARQLSLLGSSSLFDRINEGFTDQGKARLAKWFTKPLSTKDDVLRRQDKVKDLSKCHWLLTRIVIEGHLEEADVAIRDLAQFANRPLVPSSFKRDYFLVVGAYLMALSSVIFWGVAQVNPTPWIVLYILVSLGFSGRVAEVFSKSISLAQPLRLLHGVFSEIESAPTANQTFLQMCSEIRLHKPTRQLKKLERVISFLSAQANPLIHIMLNLVFPWHFTFAFLIERIRKKIAITLPSCLEHLFELEAHSSLALMYHFQTQTFPTISSKSELRVQGIYHPLIPTKDVVANDFEFSQGKRLALITGSNMAGKSTFLKTIAINQSLALAGAPVFASKMTTFMAPLGVSFQANDSIEDGFSAFYSEVLHIKDIVEHSRESTLLYCVDEIFKGTNNRERLIGSRALIHHLAKTKSLGFITTHDLELADLSKEIPELKNYHFSEGLADNEMTFPYKIKEGPCATTNALVIIKRAGIPIEEPI